MTSIPLTPDTITTIAATISSGVLALAISQKTAIPSILFFMLFGIFLGPEFARLVDPAVFRDNFPHYISLLVSLILFEGGASLKISQYRDISGILKRLLVVGPLITLVVVAAAAHYVAKFSWERGILLASVLIVTGPTVVVPILQRMRIRENVHNILKWESILIDPIGVVTAVVIYEIITLGSGHLLVGLGGFLVRLVAGAAIGLAGGWILEQLLTRRALFRFEGEEVGSLIVVAGIILFYGLAESVNSHAGLVTTAVIGMYLGNRMFAYKEHVMRFEKKITMFSLAVLFVLLSSQIPVFELRQIGRPGLILLAALIFVARPLSVFLSTRRSGLAWNEKMFVGAFAPRGIVAASLASLFSLDLGRSGADGSQFLTLSFFLIVGSIIFYTMVGTLVAYALRVREQKPIDLIIVGATPLSIALAEELRRRQRGVRFIDTNPMRCAEAAHFQAFVGSGFDLDFLQSLDLKGVGTMIAMTPSHEVNLLACQAFSKLMEPGRVLRLWDTSDTWESVTSPGYDQTMGRPILVTHGSDNIAWAFDGKSDIETTRQLLTENLRLTPETLAKNEFPHLFFAWLNDPVFATPEAFFPAGSEVVCTRISSKKQPSNVGAITKSTLERFKKIFHPENQ